MNEQLKNQSVLRRQALQRLAVIAGNETAPAPPPAVKTKPANGKPVAPAAAVLSLKPQ